MRKIFLALALAVLPVLVMTAAAPAATPNPTEQQLLIKKKKAAEARKAAEVRKAKEQKAAEAKKRQDRLALEKKKQQAKKTETASTRRNCGGFLKCLFGNKPRRGVQQASTGEAARDEPTGEDIDWTPASSYAPGSIIVSTSERRLYFVTGAGEARRYKVGVGREGFQWAGVSSIVSKAEWPTWRPPAEMIKREAAKGHMLPNEMAGGPENPLGARALYIGGKIYRIHGTNLPGSIGGAVSSGCIRMMNSDVIELYERVKIGAKVYVMQ
jgi:lipoprotein-anchoring transpeptidase ErfK/SrfK